MSWIMLPLAGFQVSTYGRFWVSTEGRSPNGRIRVFGYYAITAFVALSQACAGVDAPRIHTTGFWRTSADVDIAVRGLEMPEFPWHLAWYVIVMMQMGVPWPEV
jgi:hypothetical protein